MPTSKRERKIELCFFIITLFLSSKLQELEITRNEKAQNNRRLEAQRNDLNGKVSDNSVELNII